MTVGASNSAGWAPGAVIAACALGFTIATFWWLNVRKGRLIAYRPDTFAGSFAGARWAFRLPLAIYNTGARTLVVTGLRLVLEDGHVMFANTFRSTLKPVENDVVDHVSPIVVAGRKAELRFVEFASTVPPPEVPPERFHVCVEVRVGSEDRWRMLLAASFDVPPPDLRGPYLAHLRDRSTIT